MQIIDSTILASKKEDLCQIAEYLRQESLKYGLEINNSKTNVMCVNGKGEVQLQNDIISKVEEYKFLRSMIAAEGGSKNEIKVRLAIARSTTVLAGIWKSGEINLALKVSFAKALVWSVALYSSWYFLIPQDSLY